MNRIAIIHYHRWVVNCKSEDLPDRMCENSASVAHRREMPPLDQWEELHGLEAHATHGQDGRATKEAFAHAGTV
jgi:hypothetical protein